MSKVVAIILILGASLFSYPLGKTIERLNSNAVTQQAINTKLEVITPQAQPDLLKVSQSTEDLAQTTLVLEARNTVVFRGVVNGDTVSKAIRQITAISRDISKSEKIYLVLDTPGGSVDEGAHFIDFLAAIPQEVVTVTMFAASMGFQIVENNTGKRLIMRNGTLMSHRARGGVEGQFDGELESRYKMIKSLLDQLEATDAKRMEISLADYRAKIKDELWVHGFESKAQKVADEVVVISCGASLSGQDTLRIQTAFGTVGVVFDMCPLLRDPVEIKLDLVRDDAKEYVGSNIRKLFYNKSDFVRDIIMTDKFYKIFK